MRLQASCGSLTTPSATRGGIDETQAGAFPCRALGTCSCRRARRNCHTGGGESECQAGSSDRVEPDNGQRARNRPDTTTSGDADRGDRAVVGLRRAERHRAQVHAHPRTTRSAARSLQEGCRGRGCLRGARKPVPGPEGDLRHAAGRLARRHRGRAERPVRPTRPRLGQAGRRPDPGLASRRRHLGDPAAVCRLRAHRQVGADSADVLDRRSSGSSRT